MSKLGAPVVKNKHILAEICVAFLKEHSRPNLKEFQYQIWLSADLIKKSYQVRTILAFCGN